MACEQGIVQALAVLRDAAGAAQGVSCQLTGPPQRAQGVPYGGVEF